MDRMDFNDLVYFITTANRVRNHIQCITISNTVDATKKTYPNIKVRMIVDDIRLKAAFEYLGNVAKYGETSLPNYLKKHNRKMNTIFSKIDRAQFNIQCDNFYESAIEMETIETNLDYFLNDKDKRKQVEIVVDGYDKIKSLKNIVDEETQEMYNDAEKHHNDYLKLWDEIRSVKIDFDKIMKIVNSQKNAYIISKCLSGDLKKKDVKQYPELIKTVEQLTDLKIILNKSKKLI